MQYIDKYAIIVVMRDSNKTNQVIVLGGGMERRDRQVVLSEVSNQRVQRCLGYWTENRLGFASTEAIIVCSGGYGLLAAGVESPKDGSREAVMMADVMMAAGVPHSKLEIEANSYSTVTNWTESIRQGFVDPTAYDAEHRLGVVTHRSHFKRASDSAKRLGLSKEKLLPILVATDVDAAREALLRFSYKIGLLGAYGTETLVRREGAINTLLGRFRASKEL